MEESGRGAPARQPHFVPARHGSRMFSVQALTERVIAQFNAEHGGGSVAITQAQTPAARYRLVLDSAEYVFAVESVLPAETERATILQRAYSDLYGYGPLDALFADPSVTTILLEGADRASVRRGFGDFELNLNLFDDGAHFERTVSRLLLDAQVDPAVDEAVIECGLRVSDRPVSLTIARPPASASIVADLRCHPSTPLALDDLAASGMMNAEAHQFLRELVASGFGFAVVGEAETGKTTLVNALVTALGEPVTTVERSGEMRLVTGSRQLVPTWHVQPEQRLSFGDQIAVAAEGSPSVLVLDEVRPDEPRSIAPLLDPAFSARQIWSLRGAPDAKRLQSAMGMLARRAGPDANEARVLRIYQHLPFVITTARVRDRLQIFSIAEWQSRIDTDYPDYVMLFRYQDGESRRTDAAPARWLT